MNITLLIKDNVMEIISAKNDGLMREVITLNTENTSDLMMESKKLMIILLFIGLIAFILFFLILILSCVTICLILCSHTRAKRQYKRLKDEEEVELQKCYNILSDYSSINKSPDYSNAILV
jgi:ABC-type bacteriocin/lantibiotic exporter with double-glycine peptidase domain